MPVIRRAPTPAEEQHFSQRQFRYSV